MEGKYGYKSEKIGQYFRGLFDSDQKKREVSVSGSLDK